MKPSRLTALFLLVTLLGTQAVFADLCRARPTDYDKAKEAFRQIAEKEKADREESPFYRACQGENDLYKRPVVPLFASLNIKDKYDQTSLGFMQKLSGSVIRYANENLAALEEMERCLTTDRQTPYCAPTLGVLKSVVPQYLSEARFHLSLAMDPVWSLNISAAEPNTKLKSLRSYKEHDWNPLSAEESDRAHKTLRDYYRQASGLVHPKSDPRKKLVDTLSAVKDIRAQHMDHYQMMLSEFPMMNYLKSANPSESELLTAIRTMKAHSQREVAELSDARKSLDTKVTSKSLIFLRYKSLVEGVLIENPKLCGLGASMLSAAMNRKIVIGAAVSLPLLAASIAAPAIIPGALGLMTSVGISVTSGLNIARKAEDEYYDAKNATINKAKSSLNEGPEKARERITALMESSDSANSAAEIAASLDRNDTMATTRLQKNIALGMITVSAAPPPKWFFVKMAQFKKARVKPAK